MRAHVLFGSSIHHDGRFDWIVWTLLDLQHQGLHFGSLDSHALLIVNRLRIHFNCAIVLVILLSTQLYVVKRAFLGVLAHLGQILIFISVVHLEHQVLILVLNLQGFCLRFFLYAVVYLTRSITCINIGIIIVGRRHTHNWFIFLCERLFVDLWLVFKLKLREVKVGVVAPLAPPGCSNQEALVIFICVHHVHALEVLGCVLCGFYLADHTALKLLLCPSLKILEVLDNAVSEALQYDVLLLIRCQILAVLSTELGFWINFLDFTHGLRQRNIVILFGLVGYQGLLIWL